MYAKLICAAVLVAFVSVQLAYSLQCYQCDTPDGCRSPQKVTCDQFAANHTRQQLTRYFSNVSNVTSNNFDCMMANSTSNNMWKMEIRGCVNREVGACNLNMLPSSGLYARNCTQCSGNLCNSRNPAASVSASFLTISIALFGVFLLKSIA